MHTILILNDGSTWTHVDGCELLTITDEGLKVLEETCEPKDISKKDIVTSITFSEHETCTLPCCGDSEQ